MKKARKYLRRECYKALAVGERLFKAGRSGVKLFRLSKRDMDYDVYMGRDENGFPKLMEVVYPSVRSQVKEFIEDSVLQRPLRFGPDSLFEEGDHVLVTVFADDEDVITQRDLDIVEEAEKNVVIVERPSSLWEN